MTFIVYNFHNLVNNRRYVGSSVQFRNRSWEHVYLLRHNRHHNVPLQRAWNKYGEKNFVLEVLEDGITCDVALRQREQAWMDAFRGQGIDLYNTCETPTRTTYGMKFGPRSEAVKDKIRKSQTGKVRTLETRQLLRELREGKAPLHTTPHTPETKQKISAAKQGQMWVTDGVASKLINPADLPSFTSRGFTPGRTLKAQV